MRTLLALFLTMGSFSAFSQQELGKLPLDVLLQRQNLVISLKESLYLSKGEVLSTPLVENLKIDNIFTKSSFTMRMKMANGKASINDQEIIPRKKRIITRVKLLTEECESIYDGWGVDYIICDSVIELKLENGPYSILVNHHYLKSVTEFGKNRLKSSDFSKYPLEDIKEKLSDFMDISTRKKAKQIRN